MKPTKSEWKREKQAWRQIWILRIANIVLLVIAATLMILNAIQLRHIEQAYTNFLLI